MKLILRWLISAAAIFITAYIVPGIDIEGELSGVLPSRDWKRTRFAGKNYRDDHRKCYLGDSISAGIGQGYTAFTPLQQAHAVAIVAYNGVAFRPHIVKQVEDVRTGEVRQVAAEPARTLAVKPEHLALVREAMVGVNKEGTGTRAFAGARYLAGGKTGSLEMLVLGDELAGSARRLSAGFSVTAENLAVEVSARAAADNSFLTDEHTLARMHGPLELLPVPALQPGGMEA